MADGEEDNLFFFGSSFPVARRYRTEVVEEDPDGGEARRKPYRSVDSFLLVLCLLLCKSLLVIEKEEEGEENTSPSPLPPLNRQPRPEAPLRAPLPLPTASFSSSNLPRPFRLNVRRRRRRHLFPLHPPTLRVTNRGIRGGGGGGAGGGKNRKPAHLSFKHCSLSMYVVMVRGL